MTRLPIDLSAAIVSAGYFPEFVAATVLQAVDDEPVVASLVHHEATFERRHRSLMTITALANPA